MHARDWLLLLVLSLLWGGTFFFAAVALPDIPPLTLVLARVALAAAVLAPVVVLLGLEFPSRPADWVPFAGMALLNNAVPFTLLFYGQVRIASGLAAVLNATTPLFALVVARVATGERLAPSRLAGVLIGLVGVAILVGPEALDGSGSSLLGMLLVLGAAFSYGLSAQWGRRLRTVPPLLSAAGQLACSTLMLLPVAAAVDRFWQLPMPGPAAIAATLALALLSTALAYIIFYRILVSAGPQNVMLVTLLVPPSAIALGTLILGESISAREIAGALIIASGLVVIDGRLLGVRL